MIRCIIILCQHIDSTCRQVTSVEGCTCHAAVQTVEQFLVPQLIVKDNCFGNAVFGYHIQPRVAGSKGKRSDGQGNAVNSCHQFIVYLFCSHNYQLSIS